MFKFNWDRWVRMGLLPCFEDFESFQKTLSEIPKGTKEVAVQTDPIQFSILEKTTNGLNYIKSFFF